MATPEAPRLSPEELYSRVTKKEALIILDVRTEDALNLHPDKIRGARWMPLSSVVEQARQLPRHSTVVAYCT